MNTLKNVAAWMPRRTLMNTVQESFSLKNFRDYFDRRLHMRVSQSETRPVHASGKEA